MFLTQQQMETLPPWMLLSVLAAYIALAFGVFVLIALTLRR